MNAHFTATNVDLRAAAAAGDAGAVAELARRKAKAEAKLAAGTLSYTRAAANGLADKHPSHTRVTGTAKPAKTAKAAKPAKAKPVAQPVAVTRTVTTVTPAKVTLTTRVTALEGHLKALAEVTGQTNALVRALAAQMA
jgi:hypothetical protein